MKLSHELAVSLLLSATIAGGAAVAAQQNPAKAAAKQTPASTAPKAGDIARGQYLVESVAMCTECHTPRDANGDLQRSAWLQGAPVWIMPVHPTSNWAMWAPALAGFPYTDNQGEGILEKGIGDNGIAIRAPMHIYHMSHEDATAIIAYLRSLPPRK